MQTIQAIIDGKHIVAQAGDTVLQAARANDIYIPALCDHPAVSPFGACRLCLIQVEGSPKLFTSCTTLLSDGMVVQTRTPAILEARQTIVELILARHPLDCFSCKRNGSCELQDIAYDLGIEASSFVGDSGKKQRRQLESANPFYIRDMDKCILCGRCVRACAELAHYNAIDFQGRGINTMVQPPIGSDIENSACVFCGQCVQLCPVGALYEKPSLGKGRPWELDSTRTICCYCGVGCEIVVHHHKKTGEIANITSDHNSSSALNHGRTCVKGRFAWQFVHSPDRLTTPLIKENGQHRPASWEEALSLVAKRLLRIKTEQGPDALGFFSSARCTNEENYLMQRLAREVFSTNNIDHCAHL